MSSTAYVSLFGHPPIASVNALEAEIPPGKVRELFCYLLNNYDRYLLRKHVARALWGNSKTAQSKKYLQTALEQLRKILDASLGDADALEISPLLMRLNMSFRANVAELDSLGVENHGGLTR